MRKESIDNCLKLENNSGKLTSSMVFSGITVEIGTWYKVIYLSNKLL